MSIYYLFFLHPHRTKMQRSGTHPNSQKQGYKAHHMCPRRTASPAPSPSIRYSRTTK